MHEFLVFIDESDKKYMHMASNQDLEQKNVYILRNFVVKFSKFYASSPLKAFELPLNIAISI